MENNDIRIIVHNRETGKWELDANQLRENVEDIKLNINLNKGRKAVIGHIADQFEFIEAGKIGTFMTNIYPNIEMLDDTGNFDTPNMVILRGLGLKSFKFVRTFNKIVLACKSKNNIHYDAWVPKTFFSYSS